MEFTGVASINPVNLAQNRILSVLSVYEESGDSEGDSRAAEGDPNGICHEEE